MPFQPNKPLLETHKRLEGWLVVGIFFLPFVFAWFTLKRGYPRYTTTARAVSFVWLAVLGTLTIANIVKNANDPASSRLMSTASETTRGRAKGNTIDDIYEFRSNLASAGPSGKIILSVGPGRLDDEVKITVSNAFHYEPYQVRYQFAQDVWKIWAAIHSPNDPDASRIQIVDRNDNEVGGSRAFGGSLIWVDKN